MDNWSLRDNNESSVGMDGFVDNMQLLWKLQSLDTIIAPDENNNSESFTEFNTSTSTSDLPDDDDLVDKLFRESFAMQEMQQQQEQQQQVQQQQQQPPQQQQQRQQQLPQQPLPQQQPPQQQQRQQQQQPENTQPQHNHTLEMLLSSPPMTNNDRSSNNNDYNYQKSNSYNNDNAPLMDRKRSRSPVTMNEYPSFSQSLPPPSFSSEQFYSPQPSLNIQQQQQQPSVLVKQPQASNQRISISNVCNPSVIAQFPVSNAFPRTMATSMSSPTTFNSTQQQTMLPSLQSQFPKSQVQSSVSQVPPPNHQLQPLVQPMQLTAPMIPPRPQLRLHFKRDLMAFESLVFDDSRDPMKPDLDLTNLKRLTVATLRTLGVYLSMEELPIVDIEGPLPTDSQQVLPAAAMQLITTMVLGTSGDKHVSQTVGSQISNGDLVALQRMIVAGLRSKNIVIHTVLNESSNTDTKHQKKSAGPHDTLIDLSKVKYEPPHNVTRLFLRLYRFILNMLLSTPDCWPFIQPVPETAFLYHQEIKHPMDLYTIEENVWHGKYTKFARFEKDMLLIWKNARSFHRNAGTIPKHAENLEKLFTKIVVDIKKQIRKQQQTVGPHDFKFDPTKSLPEESDFSYPPIERVFSKSSTVYTISALSPFEPKGKKPKGLTNEKLLYLQLNGPFFQAVERMKSDLEGNHSMVPRFYISKNRTLLRQVRSQGVLAIFSNVKSTRIKGSKNIHVETDVILAYPASELFEINECTDESAPKGWIYLRPLRVLNGVTFEVNESIERDYFRRMFTTSKMAIDDKHAHHPSATKILLKKVVQTILGLPDDGVKIEEKPTPVKMERPVQRMLRTKEEEEMETNEGSDDEKVSTSPEETMEVDEVPHHEQRLGTKEMNHEVWQKLFNVCMSKGISISNLSVHGTIHWNSPNSEGFFKRVYFFDSIVVQVFRQMTMYQRITEVACLMKLRNLPHMAQLKEVLYNDKGDIAGLSMQRYQITLKQYTHVHSHHRLSAYQKYDVIYQMLICMKTIHEAGLAHRDLSEVNIMVNTVDGQFLEDGSEKVCLYLIDFGKAVFCEPADVRAWFVDVPRAEWEYDGDVVPENKEELDAWCASLPWIRGKPDHGYRMYRSIQTLPKTRSDNQVLSWLIHPQAEDIYSIGVMIWKVFTDTEPWRGILDTDLQGLRYVAEDDYRIQRALEGEVQGELSRQLLLKCLKTRPQDRETATQILNWIGQDAVKEGLIGEWKMYSSDTRSSRRAKSFYGYEDSNADDEEKKKPRKKMNNGVGKRGRPKLSKDV